MFIKYITCSFVKSVSSIGVGKALRNLQDLMWVLFYFTLISSVVTTVGPCIHKEIFMLSISYILLMLTFKLKGWAHGLGVHSLGGP